MGDQDDLVRCPRCRGRLHPSGQEVYRHVCSLCKRNFLAKLVFVEVEPLRPPELPPAEDDSAERR